MEWIIIWLATIISVIALVLLIRRQPVHDWVTVFALKTLITCFLDAYLVSAGKFEYPVRFLENYFETSLLFDLLAFPVLCVAYNQTTYRSKLPGILGQVALYSALMTGLEYILETKTNVITYHDWTWFYTFTTLTITFLAVRGAMYIIRKVNRPDTFENKKPAN